MCVQQKQKNYIIFQKIFKKNIFEKPPPPPPIRTKVKILFFFTFCDFVHINPRRDPQIVGYLVLTILNPIRRNTFWHKMMEHFEYVKCSGKYHLQNHYLLVTSKTVDIFNLLKFPNDRYRLY